MENWNYKNKNIETKYLKNILKNRFLKVKNSLLESEKYFIELKDREIKDREVKIKSDIEELFFKPIIVSIDDLDKFEQEEIKKKRTIKSTCYDWLINYICEPKRKRVGSSKDKVASLFNTSIPQQAVYGRGKNLSKPKTQKQSEENILRIIRKLFILKKGNKKN